MHAQTKPAEDLFHKKASFSAVKSGPHTRRSDLHLKMLLRESSSSISLFGELVPGKGQRRCTSIASQEGFKAPCLAGSCSLSVCLPLPCLLHTGVVVTHSCLLAPCSNYQRSFLSSQLLRWAHAVINKLLSSMERNGI